MNLNVPEPNYNYRKSKIVKAYKTAVASILLELDRIDVTDMSRAQSAAALANVAEILKGLDQESKEWVEETIPEIAKDGIARSMINLGVVETVEEAMEIIKFNRPNQSLVQALIADTQSDLLAVTKNIDRKTRGAVRRVTSKSFREKMAAGINGRKTIKADIHRQLKKELGDAVNTGIIDAGGRRWKPEHYVDMLVDTKMSEAFDEANRNESIQRGALYAVISRHGAKDACRFHEGRIVKLTEEAPGNYPTIEELKASGQIWHPKCKHHYSAIREPEGLPSNVSKLAEKQNELGNKATSTGKRNPKDIE
jgi:hypothetical protein